MTQTPARQATPTVLLTRPREAGCPLEAALARRGALVKHYPLVETRPLPFDWPDTTRFDWALFTSQVGVAAFFEHPGALPPGQWTLPIAAIGPKTAQRLEALGYPAAWTPAVSTGEGLITELLQAGILKPGQRLLWPSTPRANPQLGRLLQQAGIALSPCHVYDTVSHPPDHPHATALLAALPGAGMLALTSPSAVDSLIALLNAHPDFNLADCPPVACIGTTTARALRERLGLTPLVPGKHSFEALAERIADALSLPAETSR